MILRLFVLVSLAVAASASQKCPEKCNCDTRNSMAICSTLNLKPFGLEILKLKVINADEVKLTYQLFKNLHLDSINALYIENSTIVELDQGTFDGLRISNIVIRNSLVPEIPVLLFENLLDLTLIDFTNSTLTNFVGIQSKRVHEIVLSGCNMHTIHQDTFGDCPMLTLLNLAHNKIENFTAPRDSNVDTLNLSHNNIRYFEIPNDSMSNLFEVDLSYNPLETIVATDFDIEKLHLKSCNLKNISFISEFQELTYLDLSDNLIDDITTDPFSSLLDLETLDLSNNKLTNIPDTIFKKNQMLSKLILNGNNLQTLPQFLATNVKLTHFYCDRCNLEKLDVHTFKYLSTLLSITLSNNKLKTISPLLFQYVPSLVKLDLTNNSLTNFDIDCFKKNSNLKSLILSGNAIKDIDSGMFKYNNQLRELDISHCQIENLWGIGKRVTIPSLRILNASYNKIKIVTVDELEVTKYLDMLNLEGNSLNCGSVFNDMRNWLRKNQVQTLAKVKEEMTLITSNPVEVGSSWLDSCNSGDYTFEYTDKLDDEYENGEESEETLTVDIEQPNDYQNEFDVNAFDEKEETKPSFEIYQKSPEDEEEQFREDAEDVMIVDNVNFSKSAPHREIIVFLLPTLVFVLTALVVLIITVSIILCVIYKKNKRPNAPQINIIPWHSTKLKKHSGSVYRPLSEEKIPV